jgi:hypothetical protein
MLLGVFLPFINFLTIVFYSRALGKMGVIYITAVSFSTLVLVNFYNFYIVVFGNNVFFFNLGA